MANHDNLVVEDARIIFRNFAGNAGKYNAQGNRNFAVVVPPEIVEQMREDGWNVKTTRPREDDPDYEPFSYLPVKVSYKGRPPRIVLVYGDERVEITEDDVASVDDLDIRSADVVIRPYDWEIDGRVGRSAYLKTLYITPDFDPVEAKYA